MVLEACAAGGGTQWPRQRGAAWGTCTVQVPRVPWSSEGGCRWSRSARQDPLEILTICSQPETVDFVPEGTWSGPHVRSVDGERTNKDLAVTRFLFKKGTVGNIPFPPYQPHQVTVTLWFGVWGWGFGARCLGLGD